MNPCARTCIATMGSPFPEGSGGAGCEARVLPQETRETKRIAESLCETPQDERSGSCRRVRFCGGSVSARPERTKRKLPKYPIVRGVGLLSVQNERSGSCRRIRFCGGSVSASVRTNEAEVAEESDSAGAFATRTRDQGPGTRDKGRLIRSGHPQGLAVSSRHTSEAHHPALTESEWSRVEWTRSRSCASGSGRAGTLAALGDAGTDRFPADRGS